MRDICAQRRRRAGSLILAAALACVLGAGPWPVLAAEADAPPPEADAPPPEAGAERETEEAVERGEAPREASAPPDPTPDIFVPSEDISEDLSVRFPVDI